MPNMTGLGRYQKGLELEKEGLTGEQIAARLGYANRQAWYDARYQYGKKMKALNDRAAGNETQPKAAIEKIQEPEKAPAENPRPVEYRNPDLAVCVELSAVGRDMKYRWKDGKLSVNRKNRKSKALVMTFEEFCFMADEVSVFLRKGASQC